jgi:hypothetical protein
VDPDAGLPAAVRLAAKVAALAAFAVAACGLSGGAE